MALYLAEFFRHSLAVGLAAHTAACRAVRQHTGDTGEFKAMFVQVMPEEQHMHMHGDVCYKTAADRAETIPTHKGRGEDHCLEHFSW